MDQLDGLSRVTQCHTDPILRLVRIDLQSTRISTLLYLYSTPLLFIFPSTDPQPDLTVARRNSYLYGTWFQGKLWSRRANVSPEVICTWDCRYGDNKSSNLNHIAGSVVD